MSQSEKYPLLKPENSEEVKEEDIVLKQKDGENELNHDAGWVNDKDVDAEWDVSNDALVDADAEAIKEQNPELEGITVKRPYLTPKEIVLRNLTYPRILWLIAFIWGYIYIAISESNTEDLLMESIRDDLEPGRAQ